VADQKKLGNQASEEILKKYKEVKDDRARSFRRVGDKLIASLTAKEKGPWDYSFRVVESKEVNAFALPGGPMFIHTALLDRINSADELSAVTAHEIAHVREQHWAKQYESEVKRTLGIELLLGVTRTRGAVADIARVGNSLLSLSYSRKEEDQADDRGLSNMFAAGYDLEGMVDLFETLQKATGNKNEGPDFMRSHPLTKDRIKRTKERIERMKNLPPPPRDNGDRDRDRTPSRDRAPSRERDRYRDPDPDDN
jgi:predicted Zn-dependent protease